jgi:hypothetical protein
MERLLKEICHVSVCEDLIRQRALIVALFSSLSSGIFICTPSLFGLELQFRVSDVPMHIFMYTQYTGSLRESTDG